MSTHELDGRVLKRANPNTIQDKFLVGYQGWFTCQGDGKPLYPNHHGWLHWFDNTIPNGGHPNTDLWPDLSEYSPSELYAAPGLKNKDDEQMFLFSSRHPKTVTRHFHWMALHGVDGAFLQRFAGQCDLEAGNEPIRNMRDEVGDRVREAAEAEGRVFAIMYDVSGVHPDKIQRVLEQDWAHLMHDKRLLDSPNYLREKGKPVVALWGFGFNDRNHSPEVVRSIANFFRSSTPGGAYLMAGVPGHWRTSTSDSDRNPEFLRVWTEEFDALSPWTIGRYGNEADAERWGNEKVKPDFDFLKQRADEGKKKVDYIPVVLPGGSGYNLSGGKWGLNGIKRNGGHFLWTQIYAARRAGVRIIYGAMWDEYDEGTAYMPVVSSSKELPVHPKFDFLALDADGYSLPTDWYMRIAGFAAEALRGERMVHETFPVKELQDYWATRPRYEDPQGGDDEQAKQAQKAYQDWAMKEGSTSTYEVPPPPYSLEDHQHTESSHELEASRLPLQASSASITRPIPPVATRPSSQGSSASISRPIPPVATKPNLGRSPSASVSSVPTSSFPARTSSLTAHTSPVGNRPPAINMGSRPQVSPSSTRSDYPSDKAELAMHPQQFTSRPSSRVPSPLHSSSVAHLVNDFSRLSQSEDVSSPFQPGGSPVASSVIQMPSVEASLKQPCASPGHMPSALPRPSASPPPVLSWSQYPGQQRPYAPYGPTGHPPFPPSESRPTPMPHGNSSPTIGPAYDRYHPNMQYGHASFPQAEQYYPTDGQGSPHAIPNALQGPYMPTDNPGYPYAAPYPPQDYQQQVPPARPHPGGSNSPRPFPPPEWGMSSPPPPPPMHPQSSGYYGPNYNSGGGSGSNLTGRALDTLENIAGRDARRQMEALAQSGSKLLNKFK